jgi:signal transduction histidine kinase
MAKLGRPAARWVGLMALIALIALSAMSSISWARDEAATLIDRSLFLQADDHLPPAADRPWAEQRLPDNWSESRRSAEGIGWYRLAFDAPARDGEVLAVLIPRLSMNAELFVNGVRLMSGGRMQPPVTQNWNMPFFIEIPAPLLRSGRNELQVRLFAYRNRNCGLGRVWVGPSDVLRTDYQTLHAVHVKGSIVSFAVALVAAFIGLVGWWHMDRDVLFGLFGLAMACWAVRYTNYFVQDVPVGALTYALAVNSAQGWFAVFFTPFFLRLVGQRRAWVGPFLFAMGVAGTLAIWAAFMGWVSIKLVIGVWTFVWLPASLALLVTSARYAWQMRSARSILAALGVWLYVPLTLREFLITSNVMPFDASYVAHYVGIPLALLMVWLLVERAVDAARQAARAELATARAAFDERQRITQDMHDGLGLQLNTALRGFERGRLSDTDFAQILRACLDELRLIVDSTHAEDGSFLPLLGTLRIRLQPRLEAAGLRVDWRMDRFPPDLRLAPDATLQVMRMVQEAINNTLKHAQASVIEISVADSTANDRIVLQVRDDGRGFDTQSPRVGKGLDGMKRRAAKAGVELEIRSAQQGTQIRIGLPYRARPQHGLLVADGGLIRG